VIVDIDDLNRQLLPDEWAISTVTMAELAAGPHATSDPTERARRQERLQRVEATFNPLPFDAAAARAYGRIYAAVVAFGRKARGRRAVDLLVAATALSVELPLYTRNADDFAGLDQLLPIVSVAPVDHA
jgi:predicted nucleic acid-binding protein